MMITITESDCRVFAQNALALAIARCQEAELPLASKRQRMIILGAVLNMTTETLLDLLREHGNDFTVHLASDEAMDLVDEIDDFLK